jgi:hypothetical protein
VAWVQRHDYRGYEPADGNISWLHALTGGQILPMRILQQVVLRAPINIRPLLGVAPHESAIGRGYMAWGYTLMYRGGAGEGIRHEALACLDWLEANRSAGAPDRSCWGDPYPYATRAGRRGLGEPLLVWSALIGLAFLEAYQTLGHHRSLEVARGVREWIMRLPREVTASGSCLSYGASRQASIHNANALGAAFLARFGRLAADDEALALADEAMRYTCSRQRDDGSWYYAEEPRYAWIDNFHTGYNLSALRIYRDATQDRAFDRNLQRGLHFYRRAFFDVDGRPKYFHDRTYPLDIQCAAQAIDTLALLGAEDAGCLELATTVAAWTVRTMQAKDGHFCYRDLGWRKVSTPMLHWGQGTMVKALAVLLNALGERRG